MGLICWGHKPTRLYPLVMSNSLLWKIWTIEIDDLAIKRLVFHSYVSLPEGVYIYIHIYIYMCVCDCV